MKKIFKTFCFIFVLFLCFTFIGCSEKTDDNSSSNDNGKQTIAPEINLQEQTVTIKLGDVYNINVEVKNANATFTYEISDESVVSVKDGVATALKEGEANVKITVTCDDENKTTKELTIKVVVIDDNKVTISYSANVDGFSKVSDLVKPGSDFTLGKAPAVTGHTFIGWSLVNSLDGDVITELKNVTSDVTVYAIYKLSEYKITYVLDGGVFEGQETVLYGEYVELDSPIKEGYMFVGWTLDPNSTKYVFEFTGSEDITLYAIYMPNEYNIFYDLDEGKYDGPKTIEHDETITLGVPTKDGYTFLGWTLQRNATDYVTEITGKGNVTLYAHYEPVEHTITFELDGGSYDGETTVLHDKILQLGTPTKEGYIFLGWSLVKGSTEYIVRIYGRSDVTIYANWELAPNEYTITYDLDGGAWYFSRYTPAELGELFMVDFNAFTNYSLAPSGLDTDYLSGSKFGGFFENKENLAKWAWLIDALCLAANAQESYMASNADFSSDSVRGFYLANLNGFFTGTKHVDTWYGTEGADFRNVERSESVVSKAPLKDGGEGPAKYTEGVGVEAFPNPARDEYNFIKWVDASGNVVTSISNTQTGDITLKAVWEAKPNEYSITYVLDGGTYNGATKVNRGGTLKLDAPVKEGFAFLGWSLSSGSTDYVTEIVVLDNITLYANWIDASTEYIITYELNEGVYDGVTKVKHGDVLTLGTPTKLHYTFLGWGLTNAATSYLTEVKVTSDLTLYAIFKLTEYSIDYDLDGGDWNEVYYTPEELGEMFIKEFNAFNNMHIAPQDLDTDHMSSKKFGDFFASSDNLKKWTWLLNAICDLVEGTESIRPDVADFANDGVRGFYMANLNGFFTSTQHTDTWYKTVGQDFSNQETSKAVYEKGQKKADIGPSTYQETVGVESFPSPVREGMKFAGWVDASGKVVNSISSDQTGDITLKATWININ